MLVSLTLYSCIVEFFHFDPTMYWEHIQKLSVYEQARKWNVLGNKFMMMSFGLEKESSVTTPSQNSQNVNSSDSNSDFEPKDDESDDESDGHWSRCPRHHKALETDRCARLTKAFQKIVSNGNLGTYPKRKYYIFSERVCKAYAYLWAKNTKGDGLHMNRENTAEAAVAAVYDQIKPRKDQPHSGTIYDLALFAYCLTTQLASCNNIS